MDHPACVKAPSLLPVMKLDHLERYQASPAGAELFPAPVEHFARQIRFDVQESDFYLEATKLGLLR